MTKEEYLKLVASQKKGNKYHAEKSGKYASRKEQRRAAHLALMQQAGLISGLMEQVRYQLIPALYANGKCIERAVHYVADFVYNLPDGTLVVEDTKGFRTKEYIIKRKLMLHVHNIRITEI